MACRNMEDFIISHASGAAIPAEAAAHIAGCEGCQRLARVMAQTREFSSPSREQLDQIATGILADLKAVKPLPSTSVLAFAFVFILAIIAAVGGAVLGDAGWNALSLLQRIVVFTALAEGACVLAFSMGRQIIPGSKLPLSPYALVIAVLGVMIGICIALFHPHKESAFVSIGLVCLRIGIEYALSAGVLFWLLLRRGGIVSPMLTGATAGALAGLSGLTVLEIFCPNLNEYHILVWHLGAVLTSTAGGLLVGTIAELTSYRRNRGGD